ncbi:unnamed protein product, partial [Prorocentrum cordatum]
MSARGARVPSLLLACLPLCHHRSGSQVRREARAPSRMQRVPRDVRPVRAERRRLAPCLHSSAAAAYPSAVSAAILWHRPALDSDVLRPQLAGAPCALFFWAYHARAAWLQVHLVFFEFPTDASICLTLAPGGVVQHRPGGSAPRPVWRFGCPRGLSGGHARRRSSEGCQPCARALGSTELESRTCHVGAPSPSSSARLLLRLWSTASLHPRYPCPPLLQKTQAAESLGRGRHLGSTRSVPWSLCAASCPPASAGLQHEQCILENNRGTNNGYGSFLGERVQADAGAGRAFVRRRRALLRPSAGPFAVACPPPGRCPIRAFHALNHPECSMNLGVRRSSRSLHSLPAHARRSPMDFLSQATLFVADRADRDRCSPRMLVLLFQSASRCCPWTPKHVLYPRALREQPTKAEPRRARCGRACLSLTFGVQRRPRAPPPARKPLRRGAPAWGARSGRPWAPAKSTGPPAGHARGARLSKSSRVRSCRPEVSPPPVVGAEGASGDDGCVIPPPSALGTCGDAPRKIGALPGWTGRVQRSSLDRSAGPQQGAPSGGMPPGRPDNYQRRHKSRFLD